MVSVCNRMIIDKMSKYIIIQVHTLFFTCAGVLKCFKCTCCFIERFIIFISAPHVLEYFMKDRSNITYHLYSIFFHNLSIYSIWLRPDGVLHIIIFCLTWFLLTCYENLKQSGVLQYFRHMICWMSLDIFLSCSSYTTHTYCRCNSNTKTAGNIYRHTDYNAHRAEWGPSCEFLCILN